MGFGIFSAKGRTKTLIISECSGGGGWWFFKDALARVTASQQYCRSIATPSWPGETSSIYLVDERLYATVFAKGRNAVLPPGGERNTEYKEQTWVKFWGLEPRFWSFEILQYLKEAVAGVESVMIFA